MVRLQTLDLRIGVRVPASQPTPPPAVFKPEHPFTTCDNLVIEHGIRKSGKDRT
jgi:hypothetical protein